jgi:6-phosphogluconolactonase
MPPPDAAPARGGAGGGGGGSGGSAADASAAADASPEARPSPDVTVAAGSPYVYVGGSAAEIRIFQLDTQTGALAARGSVAAAEAGNNPGFMAFHPSKKFLFAANRSPSKVTSFSINAATGALTKINEAPTGMGDGGAAIVIDRSGKWAFVAHTGSSTVTVHPIADSGMVGAPVEQVMPGMFTHMAMPDPAGKFLFVMCLQSDYVAQLAFNGTSGKLSPNAPPTMPWAMGAGPRHMTFHPSAKFSYVIAETNSTITSYGYDAATGLLSDPQVRSTIPEGFTAKNTGAHVLVHPSGKFVYASNRGHDSIAIFTVDQTTGRLTLLGHETGDGMIKTPRNFSIDDAGRFLLVANQGSNDVLVFRIQSDGKLMRAGAPIPTASGPTWVGVLPP